MMMMMMVLLLLLLLMMMMMCRFFSAACAAAEAVIWHAHPSRRVEQRNVHVEIGDERFLHRWIDRDSKRPKMQKQEIAKEQGRPPRALLLLLLLLFHKRQQINCDDGNKS